MPELNHNCGLFAVYDLAGGRMLMPNVVHGIRELGHRGQQSAGIARAKDDTRRRTLDVIAGPGQAQRVFPEPQGLFLDPSRAAVGHTRYSTSPGECYQPLLDPQRKIAVAFNGTLANFSDLKLPEEITDTQLLLRVALEEISADVHQRCTAATFLRMEELFDGAFNVAILQAADKGHLASLDAYRDASGKHPLLYSVVDDLMVVASEDWPIRQMWEGAYIKDVPPGGHIHAEGNQWSLRELIKDPKLSHCFFEWVYFAFVESKLDGESVRNFRHRTGKLMAQIDPEFVEKSFDHIVFPVPESAKAGGNAYAQTLGLRTNYRGIERNPQHRGREFMLEQKEAKHLVHPEQFRGKVAIIWEDSIVRARTLMRLLQDVRAAQPREIHVRLGCPPIFGICPYGIDIQTIKELFAPAFTNGQPLHGDTLGPEILEAMAQRLEVTSIKFLPKGAVSQALNKPSKHLCMACVDGKYPTPKGRELYQQLREQYINP
ncbi:MAG: hypothetical protein WCX61_00180 [Candidatus Peribacteraceae bacterium]